MPLDNRDYVRGSHPTTCTCTICVAIKQAISKYHPNSFYNCPHCHWKTLRYFSELNDFSCVNPYCPSFVPKEFLDAFEE
jgi:hypothetical protein